MTMNHQLVPTTQALLDEHMKDVRNKPIKIGDEVAFVLAQKYYAGWCVPSIAKITQVEFFARPVYAMGNQTGFEIYSLCKLENHKATREPKQLVKVEQ